VITNVGPSEARQGQKALVSGEARFLGREFPATLDQEQRLLFREIQQERSAPVFSQRLIVGFRIRGNVETQVLQDVLNELARRHAALRVRFAPASNTTPEERREKTRRFMRTGSPRPDHT
jgi:hypothetical protein